MGEIGIPWRYHEEGEDIYIVPRTRKPSLDLEESKSLFQMEETPAIFREIEDLDNQIDEVISELENSPRIVNGKTEKVVKRKVKHENIVGGPYNGRYDGITCGFDEEGEFFVKEGPEKDYLQISCPALWELFCSLKPRGGLFKVTSNGSLVTPMFIDGKGAYRRIYLGKAEDHGIYF